MVGLPWPRVADSALFLALSGRYTVASQNITRSHQHPVPAPPIPRHRAWCCVPSPLRSHAHLSHPFSFRLPRRVTTITTTPSLPSCRRASLLKALDSVFLLPVATLLETGRFPSYYDASRKKHLVAGSAVSPQSQVLLVSHPWESPGNPDPSGKQFLALRRFLEEAGGGGGGTVDGEGAAGFGYVWLSFSCTSSNRMKPTFQTHLNNVLTVSGP